MKLAMLFAAAMVGGAAIAACTDHSQPLEPLPPSGTASASQGAGAGGPVIQRFPQDFPGPPFYVNLRRDFMPSDGGWVGITFVRQPACVPAGFNLLDFFAAPAAFSCALTIQGRVWWNDPDTDAFPYHIRQEGLGAVPTYFVLRSELDAASADDVLTIGELQALPSLLVGYASYLENEIHNSNQGRRHGHEAFVSRGALEDGRSFVFRFNERFFADTGVRDFPNVRIEFR